MKTGRNDPTAVVRRGRGPEIAPDAVSLREDGREAASSAVIRGLLVDFCGRFLTYEATTRAFTLCDRLEQGTAFSLHRGRPKIWAAAIIYAIAQVNFLFGADDPLGVTREAVHAFFGTKPDTVRSKARMIRDTLAITIGHPDFCTQDIVDACASTAAWESTVLPKKSIARDRAAGSPAEGRRPSSNIRPEKNGPGKETPRRAAGERQMRLFDE